MQDSAAEDRVVAAGPNEGLANHHRQFFQNNPWIKVGISILVLLPCFWHRTIQAGDLGSHVYNSWLAQLVERGQAPGLYMVRQWNNVLADVALTRIAGLLGFPAAERIVVGTSVLIFFWGAFAFIAAATRQAPWSLVPVIAMVTYGWTFQMGFLNYYLSLGLAFCALALFWRARTGYWLVGVALAALAISAHLMGFLWLAGTVVYLKAAERIPRYRWMLLIAACLTILTIHFYVSHIYRAFQPVSWHVYYFLGFDQFVLYGRRYRALSMVTFLLGFSIVASEGIRERKSSTFWRSVRAPLELWLIAVFATAMLWADIMMPKYATGFTYVASRLTSVTAILGLCIIGCVPQRRWQTVVFAACAVVFFGWIYQDTGRLSGMEEQAERLVGGLPYGARVIQTILMPPGTRIGADHILDQACIGRCFSYANYEPASGQFRVRAAAGNPVVTASSEISEAMQQGRYIVRPEDLPITQIYQCDDRDLTKLCMRSLLQGEVNGRIGHHPTK
jgi:hypothetical protein